VARGEHRHYDHRMAPSDAINAVEIVLRDLIEQVLTEEYGEQWIEQCGTPEKIEKWRERKVEEAKKRDGTTTEQRLLHYSDFTDLAPIIKKHWELFKPCLGDRKTFDVYMHRLDEFRNAPMHSRALVPFEGALAEGMAGEIRNKVTIYRTGRDPVDRHFPRIEYVRDSLGNVATNILPPSPVTDILQTGLTLYPGDEISFECSGWDPEDGPLKWTMQLLPGGQPLVEEQGRQVSFMWRVTEANISAQTFVRVRLISDRPWHRTTDNDDMKTFTYTVLPGGDPSDG
jgi:Swt1-like HEPN